MLKILTYFLARIAIYSLRRDVSTLESPCLLRGRNHSLAAWANDLYEIEIEIIDQIRFCLPHSSMHMHPASQVNTS